MKTKFKFEKSTMILYDIVICQRSPHDKAGIGFDNNQNNVEKGEISKLPKKNINKKSKSYANVIKGENNNRKINEEQ